MKWVNSYDRAAPTPEIGSRWVWEPDLPHACQIVTVDEVKWNGEEWWVKLDGYWNDLSRFWEACVPLTPRRERTTVTARARFAAGVAALYRRPPPVSLPEGGPQ